MIDPFGVLIDCEDLAPFAHQVDQVPAVTATGIEHPHARCDVSTQNLVEDININLPELLLYAQGHRDTFSCYQRLGIVPGVFGCSPTRILIVVQRISFQR